MDHTQRIPLEAVRHIYKFLTVHDMATLACVSVYWADITALERRLRKTLILEHVVERGMPVAEPDFKRSLKYFSNTEVVDLRGLRYWF